MLGVLLFVKICPLVVPNSAKHHLDSMLETKPALGRLQGETHFDLFPQFRRNKKFRIGESKRKWEAECKSVSASRGRMLPESMKPFVFPLKLVY